jgi:hypothetical protein
LSRTIMQAASTIIAPSTMPASWYLRRREARAAPHCTMPSGQRHDLLTPTPRRRVRAAQHSTRARGLPLGTEHPSIGMANAAGAPPPSRRDKTELGRAGPAAASHERPNLCATTRINDRVDARQQWMRAPQRAWL